MTSTIDPYLTNSDLVVLRNLFEDVSKNNGISTGTSSAAHIEPINSSQGRGTSDNTKRDIQNLKAVNDPQSQYFQPTVFVTWDDEDIHPWLNKHIIRPYARIATRIVRHPTDVVFLTHILLYLSVNLPSAAYLFHSFTYVHGIAHAAFTFWCTGGFTLMMHNHIHNNGVLKKSYAWFDFSFPYVLEPLMGHTWDSYYYHHVKHHHVEGNGPEDLSSTIRYQRDDAWNFAQYVGRFLFFIWIDLPVYFLRKNKPVLATKAFLSEMASMAFMYFMTFHVNTRAAVFTLLIPFVLLRLGLMIGNWGQHALVDELEPDSDFRSSITLIDVPSNRFCFNDGYHTAHHLNPLRHWRDQPLHFLQSKEAYSSGRALVFHNIDYLMLTFNLLTKNYAHLAKCLVPIGEEQIKMSQQEIADMLRTKTKRFSEEDIRAKFGKAEERKKGRKQGSGGLGMVLKTAGLLVPGTLGLMALRPQKVEAESVQQRLNGQ